MAYQIVWPRCNVFDQEGNRYTFKRGALVPDELVNADRDQMDRLVTVGAVQFVDVADTVPNTAESDADGTTSESEDGNTDELVKPSEDDTKDVWVSYATDERNPDRISATEARSFSKAALIERFRSA